jgi:hypothetical protein
MPERCLGVAFHLAKILFNTRERFAYTLRDAAARRAHDICSEQISIPRCLFEPHVDNAIHAIFRDGLEGFERDIRLAVDEITREALDAARRGTPRA